MDTNLATLTSLAMLRVRIDSRGGDYVEYLVPFVMHILSSALPDVVTDETVASALRQHFGLRIPTRGVHLVLQRLAKRGLLERREGRYTVARGIPATDVDQRRDTAGKEIDEVVTHLRDFARGSYEIEWSESEATDAIVGFLSKFSVDCLRAYAFGTTLPHVEKQARRELFIVGAFMKAAHTSNGPLFEKIMVLVKGHMLANALVCPDLESIEKKFGKVTFFFDTPLLLDILGLQSPVEHEAQIELLNLLRRLTAKLAVFSHTVDELHAVLKGAESALDTPNGRGGRLVAEMRRRGKTRSDLILVKEKLPELLRDAGFSIVSTPEYTEKFQISEKDLEEALHDEISYFNERAASHDVNCVRSIYVLRQGRTPIRLEDAVAVFVTSNSAFARTAFEYGREHESTREVSAVITDFSLSNVAWLKAPLGAPQLPVKEMLATCYAVMSPSAALWTRYAQEIDALWKKGKISADDHQILRSAVQSQDELMALTQGEDALLKPATITQILDRVRADLTRDKDAELAVIRTEKSAAEKQAQELATYKQSVVQRAFWIGDLVGKLGAHFCIVLLAAALVAAAIVSPLATTAFVRDSYILTALTNAIILIAALFGAVAWAFDVTVGKLHNAVRGWLRARIIRFLSRLTLQTDEA